MAHVNTAAREITAKLVYYGPGLCGKTTNLEQIYSRVDPSDRGRLLSLQTDEDRTLLFDMMPVSAGSIKGLNLRFQLYTVPGQVYYNSSRKRVLRGTDGIVFVADSHPSRFEANVESMQNLYDNMAALGEDMDDVPLVIQYNKRDLPGAIPVEALEQALNYDGVPAWQAVAIEGVGVFETLAELMKQVEEHLRRTLF